MRHFKAISFFLFEKQNPGVSQSYPWKIKGCFLCYSKAGNSVLIEETETPLRDKNNLCTKLVNKIQNF